MPYAAFFLLLASPLLAADPQVHRDLPYAEPKNERQLLDVYSPAGAENRPIVFWIHGGGWKAGDKTSVKEKSKLFVDQGYVFVATNYRFIPHVTVPQMAGDLAKSLRYVHDHAQEYGGDPNHIIVMGHSAGAQLAALICTDERYLKEEKLSLSILKGCVPIDCSFYDIPKRVQDGGDTPPATIHAVFTENGETQRDCSAVAHISKGKHIPPFLILHVAERKDTTAQAHWLADKLQAADISAKVIGAKGKTHGSIMTELGVKDDEPTQAMWEFLKSVKP